MDFFGPECAVDSDWPMADVSIKSNHLSCLEIVQVALNGIVGLGFVHYMVSAMTFDVKVILVIDERMIAEHPLCLLIAKEIHCLYHKEK